MTQPAILRPFRSKPHVAITAPVAVATIAEALGLDTRLSTGTRSGKAQGILSAAVSLLAGPRRPTESAESYAARAQSALNARFAL